MRCASLATALCFIAYGTAAPLIPRGPDSPWVYASAELKHGVLSGQAPPLIPYPGGKGYVSTQDYHVTLNGVLLVIPKGFLFDGASIPDFVPKWVIGSHFDPEFMLAAFVHDWLYWSHQWSKAEADLALRALLRASGVGALKAAAMYRAVDLAGGFAWRSGPVVTDGSVWIIQGDDLVPHPVLIRTDAQVAA